MRTIFGRLVGVSPALDGAFIEVIDTDDAPQGTVDVRYTIVPPLLYEVYRFGGMPVEKGSMYVNFENIDQLSDAPKVEQLGTDNSYGPYLHDVQWTDDTARLTITVYERATHLNLRHGLLVEDTVVWNDDDRRDVLNRVERYKNSGSDVVDFIFEMREFKKGRH